MCLLRIPTLTNVFYFTHPSSRCEPPSTTIDIHVLCDPPSLPTSSATSDSPQPHPSVPIANRPPLQVYSRRHRCQPPPHDSHQVASYLSPPIPTTESDLPIALRKGMRCSGRVFWIGMSSSQIFIWPKAVSSSLV